MMLGVALVCALAAMAAEAQQVTITEVCRAASSLARLWLATAKSKPRPEN